MGVWRACAAATAFLPAWMLGLAASAFPLAAQRAAGGWAAGEDSSRHAESATLAVIAIGGKGVVPGAVNVVDEDGDLEVLVSAWNLGPGERVWVLIKPEDGGEWFGHGPAYREEGAMHWKIPMVAFGRGLHQGRAFRLLAIAGKGDFGGSRSQSEVARASRFSQPLRVDVGFRSGVVPQGECLRIEILNVDGHPVDPVKGAAISASPAISGALYVPRAESGSEGRYWVYLVIHPISTDVFILTGPEMPAGGAWSFLGTFVGANLDPTWQSLEIGALVTDRRLETGRVGYEEIARAALAKSRFVKANLTRPLVVPDSSAAPSITLTRWDNQGRMQPIPEDRLRLDKVTGLGGEMRDPPLNGLISVLVGPLGWSELMVLDGFTEAGASWRSDFHFRPPASWKGSVFSCRAVVTQSFLGKGIVSSASLRGKILAASPPILLHRPKAPVRKTQPTLEILTVNGLKVESSPLAIRSRFCLVTGTAEGYMAGDKVRLCVLDPAEGKWHIAGEYPIRGGQWEAETLLPDPDPKSPRPIHLAYAMIASGLPLPATATGDQIAGFLEARSEPVSIALAQFRGGGSAGWNAVVFSGQTLDNFSLLGYLWLLIPAIALVGLAILSRKQPGWAEVVGLIGRRLTARAMRMRAELEAMEKLKLTDGILACIIAVALGTAAIWYFPLYTKVLASGLALSSKQAAGCAMAILICLALSGFLLKLFLSKMAPVEGSDAGSSAKSGAMRFWALLLPALLLLFSFTMLCYFQYTAYHEFYRSQAGDSAVPRAMALATIFFSMVEFCASFWVAALGVPFLASVMVSGLETLAFAFVAWETWVQGETGGRGDGKNRS